MDKDQALFVCLVENCEEFTCELMTDTDESEVEIKAHREQCGDYHEAECKGHRVVQRGFVRLDGDKK